MSEGAEADSAQRVEGTHAPECLHGAEAKDGVVFPHYHERLCGMVWCDAVAGVVL